MNNRTTPSRGGLEEAPYKGALILATPKGAFNGFASGGNRSSAAGHGFMRHVFITQGLVKGIQGGQTGTVGGIDGRQVSAELSLEYLLANSHTSLSAGTSG
jgi:hypothetical protein